MAALSSSHHPSGAFIDPSKQAEYPIVLGATLSGKSSSQNARLVNITYNYKSKSATSKQRSVITRSSRAKNVYNLTITDKPPSSESHSLVYSYEGSVDPSASSEDSNEKDFVLAFDPKRKAVVLECISTRLNFNLRSAPGKTEKQASEQYAQLKTLLDDGQSLRDARSMHGSSNKDEEPPDESNPYDYRHFLPKAAAAAAAEDDKPASHKATPEMKSKETKANRSNSPAVQKKSTAVSAAQKQPQANPLRPMKKRSSAAKPSTASKSQAAKPSSQPTTKVDSESIDRSELAHSDEDTGTSSQKPAPSPGGSNIIIDGNLIIDMGSPPPSRRFNVNPAHFSSHNTPSNPNLDEEEELEPLRLPSPANRAQTPMESRQTENAPSYAGDMEDDDGLAAEMEAALEESAREEEEARSQQYDHSSAQRQCTNVPSDDESEVSEEE